MSVILPTFQEAYEAAVRLCGARNCEIRKTKDGRFELTYEEKKDET